MLDRSISSTDMDKGFKAHLIGGPNFERNMSVSRSTGSLLKPNLGKYMLKFGWKRGSDGVQDNRKEYNAEFSLAILGTNETGKTTILRQMEMLSEDRDLDIKHYQRLLYANTINTMLRLIEANTKYNIPIGEDCAERINRILALPTTLSNNKGVRFPLKSVYDFKCLWEDPGIQKTIEALERDGSRIPGRPRYYMDNIFRIMEPDFRPEEVDILSSYEQTEAVQTAEVYIKKFKINCSSFPGSTTVSRKWQDVQTKQAIFYVVNPSHFDEHNPGDKSKNRLLDSLDALDSLVKACTATHIFLIFNFSDIFRNKAAKVDMKCCFSDYGGGCDPVAAFKYLQVVFSAKVSAQNKTFSAHEVCALDKGTIAPVLNEIIDQIRADLPPTWAVDLQAIKEEPKPSSSSSSTKVIKSPRNKKRIIAVESGVESVQGRRKTMEDTHAIIDDVKVPFPGLASTHGVCGYWGVYDGHGGGDTAKTVESMLHKAVLEQPQFVAGNHEAGIQAAFAATDEYIVKQPSKSGSTAVVAVLLGDKLIVANAGDSELIMGKMTGTGKKAKYEHVTLSHKHSPNDPAEKARITACGGMIYNGRLFGSLAVARSFGDKDYKDGQMFVTAEPYISQTELNPEHQFFVLACDGLWDKMPYDDVIQMVARLRQDGKSATEISKALAQEALTRDSMDNVTVVTVFLQWKR